DEVRADEEGQLALDGDGGGAHGDGFAVVEPVVAVVGAREGDLGAGGGIRTSLHPDDLVEVRRGGAGVAVESGFTRTTFCTFTSAPFTSSTPPDSKLPRNTAALNAVSRPSASAVRSSFSGTSV